MPENRFECPGCFGRGFTIDPSISERYTCSYCGGGGFIAHWPVTAGPSPVASTPMMTFSAGPYVSQIFTGIDGPESAKNFIENYAPDTTIIVSFPKKDVTRL